MDVSTDTCNNLFLFYFARTSVATGYNLAQCIAGGTSPAIATLLADDVGVNAPGWLLTILAAIALFGLRFVAPNQASSSSIAA